jgi:hypothetical protein
LYACRLFGMLGESAVVLQRRQLKLHPVQQARDVSITVDYFFNSPESLTEVAQAVGRALGVRFEPYEDDPSDLFCRFLSMEFSLHRHGLDVALRLLLPARA